MKRLIIIISFLFLWNGEAQARENPRLDLIQTIILSNVNGRLDHMDIDVAGQRLFVAALGNDTLEVIDLKSGQRIQSIKGFAEPQGVLYLDKQIFVTNGDSGDVDILDGSTYHLLKKVSFSDDADNIRYAKREGLVYIGAGNGALGIIDVKNNAKRGDIPLSGHPESFQLEESGSRIFVNIPQTNEIVVIDRGNKQIVDHWIIPVGKANFPMALDEGHHRLFVGLRDPSKLAVFDTASGKMVAVLDLAADVDDIFYDQNRQQLYATCGEGLIEIFKQIDDNTYQVVDKIKTVHGARTSFFSPELHELFLAVPDQGDQPAKILVYKVN